METTIKDMVKSGLKRMGAEGLAGEECGCALDDLMPCGETYYDCVAAKMIPCDNSCDVGSCDGHFVPIRKELCQACEEDK